MKNNKQQKQATQIIVVGSLTQLLTCKIKIFLKSLYLALFHGVPFRPSMISNSPTEYIEPKITKFDYKALGVLSKKEIHLDFIAENYGFEGEIINSNSFTNIFFQFPDNSKIEATVENLKSAQRNTVLGNENNSICFVEHLLAVINLLSINYYEALIIQIDGQEIPLEDGSGKTWKNLFNEHLIYTKETEKLPKRSDCIHQINLQNAFHVSDKQNRSLVAIPADKFKMSYLFMHPVTKEKQWVSWETDDDINLLINARTFASTMENEMMGVKGKVLSYDQNGFDLEFRHEHEPIYHKLLDLFGDLSLCGVNPLYIKAHFISYMGSHSLNTEMAKVIKTYIQLARS